MDVEWKAPGPGQWSVDRSHMPSGTTPIVQHIASVSMPAGNRRMFLALGAPLDTLDARFVNGQVYTRLRPLIAPDRPATKLPPAFVLKAAMRLHPEMRRRNRIAGEVRVTEPWNAVIDDWHHGGRAAIEQANLALQSVDLAALDDDGVVAHVQRCIDHCLAQWEHHFWLHGFDLGPIGQYLYEAAAWGVEPAVLLSLLEGASPSSSAPACELAVIREAVESTHCTPNTLDQLRALSKGIAQQVDEYLAKRGAVLFSRYDLDGVTLGERPDLVLAAILNAQVHDTSAEVAARTAAVRDSIPADHLERFDEVLRQARTAMDLRDDNGPMTAEWPVGLLRLAMLELGRRAVACGSIEDGALVMELEPQEVHTVLAGTPSALELGDRAAHRSALKQIEPPRLLGPAEPAPPLDVMPPNLARMVGMILAVIRHMGMDGEAAGHGLQGVGIGTTAVTARARVATSPETALDMLEPGDILVVAGTTPAYNLVLSIAGGVVTAEGGAMSHAAVIARELGIPAVVGARGALTDIPDGSLVTIDPVAGEVRVVG